MLRNYPIPVSYTHLDVYKRQGQNQEPAVSIPVNNSSTANPSTFAFTSTNFDDGWQSTAKEDWVEVTKDNIKVLLHYPKAVSYTHLDVYKRQGFSKSK